MEAQPNCAICNGPSNPECPCESERLSMAVRQAEDRALKSRLHEIRYGSHVTSMDLYSIRSREVQIFLLHCCSLLTVRFQAMGHS